MRRRKSTLLARHTAQNYREDGKRVDSRFHSILCHATMNNYIEISFRVLMSAAHACSLRGKCQHLTMKVRMLLWRLEG